VSAPTNTLIWTIGSGGLIGSAINQKSEFPFQATPVRWSDSNLALIDLKQNLNKFLDQSNQYSRWAIVWAAGSATTSTHQDQADQELELFQKFIDELSGQHPNTSGEFLLISSAGGIYAGSSNPPFTEDTPPCPIGIYGALKLAQEDIARNGLAHADFRVTIARVSNAYGPGQDLTKLQGLISRLALGTIKRDPLNLFVPLSTVRDFIYTEDLAARVQQLICEEQISVNPRIRIIASETGSSLAYVIKVCQDVFHRKIPIAFGSHPSASAQAADLRFTSKFSDQQDSLIHVTSLPVGIKAVFDDLLERSTQGSDLTTVS
jgi:UDP-glucose 4-epimerase